MEKEKVPIQVLFFAKAREMTGQSNSQVKLSKAVTARQIQEELENNFPDLLTLRGLYVLALNEEYLNITSEDLVVLSPGKVGIVF